MNKKPYSHQQDGEDEEHISSRTEQKKSMQQYVTIGQQLLELSDQQLDTIPLNADIIDALQVAKKINVGNALKRQLSFLAKLIRKNKPEAIQAALDNQAQKNKQYDQISQKAERWRDRLLAEENEALSEFIQQYPCDERQKLGQITRHAIKESQQQQKEKDRTGKVITPSKYKKQLFVLLRTYIA